MNKIFVVSTNKVKIESVKKVFIDYQVESISTSTSYSQPIGFSQTYLCLTERINNCQENCKIALESGIDISDNNVSIINLGLLQIDNNSYFIEGPKIPLPSNLISYFNSGYTLEQIMEKVYHQVQAGHNQGAVSYFTNGLVTRSDIYQQMIKIMYGMYLKGKSV